MNLKIDTEKKIIQVMDDSTNLRDLFEWLNNHIKDWGNYTLDRPDNFEVKLADSEKHISKLLKQNHFGGKIVTDPRYYEPLTNDPLTVTYTNEFSKE